MTNTQRLNVKHVVVHTVTTVFKSVSIADSSDKLLSSAVRDMQTARHIARGIKTNAVNMVKRHTSFERDCTSPFDLPAKSICYLEDRKVTMAPQNFDQVRSQRCSLETVRLCVLGLFDADVSQDGSHSRIGPAHHESPLKGVCAALTSVVVMGAKIGP